MSTTRPPTPPAPPATTSPWARRRKSPLHGWGMIATKDIPAGTRIIEYVGKKITKAESARIEAAREERRARGGAGHVWIFDLNKTHDIDGDVSWNTARHINHSCTPNAQSDKARGHIWITARRDIPAGEEITFDYGFPYATWRDHPCCCGTKKCVGYIVASEHRWRVKKILRAEKTAARKRARAAQRVA